MLDKRRIRQSFDRAAATYDEFSVVQGDIADQLLRRITEVDAAAARRILDLGCGTGQLTRRLARHFRRARVIGLDLSPAMVRLARSRQRLWSRTQFLCGDMERLPFDQASMDLVVSNLALQWCDAPTVFAEVARVLRPGGHFLFSTFGPDTLKELRAAWAAADSEVHVHGFVDMHELGDALLGLGFGNPVLDVDVLRASYGSVDAVMADLRGVGAHNSDRARKNGLTGRKTFTRFRNAYQALAVDGRIPASYEAIYGFAQAPTASRMSFTGTVSVPLSDIGKRR
jgi:malonyl-CoA O-methyltransferase